MSARGTIYFIASPETGRLKIGFTSGNPNARLKALQTGSPTKLALLAFEHGTMEREQYLHNEFADERLHGEWFDTSDRLLAYLGYVCWRACKEATDAGDLEPTWARIGLNSVIDEFGPIPDGLFAGTVQ